jgi:pimeloyl-ACP methyl ester carboxylesterase
VTLRRAFSILIILCAAHATAEERFPSWLRPWDDEVPGALCGTYEVWEDRDAKAGRRIELFVVVLPATGPGPYAAPIVPLAGGPGQAASDGAGLATTLFGSLRETRDVVLLDQRGTGRSHKLDCGVLPADAPLQEYFDDFPSPAFARDCLDMQDANVALYTTDMAVRDLEELREEMGYAQLNLIGGSYGTRVALHYMRRYPDRVRSAVLDGVSPPHTEYHAQFAPAFEKTLEHLFERCANDPECMAEFPDLASDWSRALDRFSPGALSIVTEHPETGEQESISFSRGVFVDGVRRMLYQAQGWQRVASIIHAAAEGEFSQFIERRYHTRNAVMQSLSLGMLLTISCTESVPFVDDDTIERITAGTSLGDHRARTIKKACEEWPAGTLPSNWSEPVAADTPVLIISGAVDPATPPWVAAEAAAFLPNALHLAVPNRSHAPTNFACENGVIQAFIDSGTAVGLDIDCLEATAWPAFQPNVTPVDAATVDLSLLESYVGSYELQPGFVLAVSIDEGQLFIKPPGEPRHALRPETEETFVVEGLGERLTFKRNEAGVVDRFQLENGPAAKKIE